MVYKPKWFSDGQVFVSYAPTVGINKDGNELFRIDSATGQRTGVLDDQLLFDVEGLMTNTPTETSQWINMNDLTERLMAVPAYFDARPMIDFQSLMASPDMKGFTSVTLGELIDQGRLRAMNGHGSPSADLRRGDIPYIKVSDIRAGQVNINPTNRVSRVVAEQFWKSERSGLLPWDLITPIRTSKNIGDFAVLMSDQTEVLLTKEVLVLRTLKDEEFDNFYLLWALSLKAVRRQWERIVFMQTNREDVGKRYREIVIPLPPDSKAASRVSQEFRKYYLGMDRLRRDFVKYLNEDDQHHVFLAAASETDTENDE